MTTTASGAGARGPAPLRIRLPAIPASLAVVRAHLRTWLPTAAVNAATAADILLAVGEARDVMLEVTARATDTGLALTVKDNGRWRAPASGRGQRGYGSTLMRALVDSVTITPTPRGTTVEMRKELHP